MPNSPLRLRFAALLLLGMLPLACGQEELVSEADTAQDQAADPGPQPDTQAQPDVAEVQTDQDLPPQDLVADLDPSAETEVAQDVTPDIPDQPDAPDAPPGIPCKVNDDCPPATEACTEARCEAKLGLCKVVQAKENAPCDDGESCTVGDLCKAGQCQAGQNGCGCGKDSDCAAFDDGNPCNGKWFCDGSVSPTVCAPKKGSQVVCPPSDSPCSANVCSPVTGACEVTATNDGGACEDGKVCTSGDHCAAGACVPGTDECPCKKNSDCTDDGDLCNGLPYCDKSDLPWTCKTNPGTVVNCSAAGDTACQANTCDAKSGKCALQPTNQGGSCNDGDPCTGGDSCDKGQCSPGVNTCGCQNDGECQKFDDGNLCNGALYCNKAVQPHQCQVNPATVVVCPSADDTACSQNKCEPSSGKCAVQLAKDGSPCDDDNPCTQGDACTTGQCAGPTNICPCSSNTQCAAKDDGNLCNGSLFCDKSKLPYQCNLNPATVIKCSTLQDNSCQRALCTPATGNCQLAPVNEGVGCDADANACTVGDVCSSGLCKPGANTCPCTQDTDCKPWEDGNLCNGTLYCDKGAKACLINPNTVVTCTSAGDTTCAANTCNPTSGKCAITPRNQGQPCDGDGNACTVGDVCDKGTCVVGTNTCGCQNNSDCTAMNDNNLCNGTLYCDKATLPFQCKVNPVTVKDCSKGTPPICQVNSCNPVTGACGFAPVEDYSPCSDNSLCTVGDTCKNGNCVPGSNLCECFADSDCGAKEDGNQCNGTLYCDKGKVPFKCKVNPASIVICDPTSDQPCVKNLCQAGNGACAMTVLNDAAKCDDGNVCTLQDQCSKGLCTGGEVVCNDGNACTFDDCDPVLGCMPIANAVAACDDGNACTIDSCNAKAGCAHSPSSGSQVCSDGDPCSGPDLCQAGVCQGKIGGGCDDGNPCTTDSCSSTGKACLHTPNTAPCGDDLVCSGGRCGGCGAFARQQRVGCDLVVGWPYYDKIPEQCKITVNNDREEGEDLIELSDGRLAMVGAASTDGSASTKGWLIVMESTGKWVGDWTFGKAGLTRPLSAASDGKGGLWTAGVTANATGTARPWLVHLSGNGAILSETLLPAEATAGSASGQFDAVAVLSDGSVVAAGFSQLPSTSTTDALVARFDPQGKPLWQKAFGGSTPGIAPQNERLWGAIALAEGTIVLTGQRANPKTAQKKTDGWLLKIDAAGELVWSRELGGLGHDVLFGLAQRQDGGFMAVGSRDRATANGAGKAWAVRLDALGYTAGEALIPGRGDDSLRFVGWSSLGGWVAGGSQVFDHSTETGKFTGGYDRGHAWYVRFDDAFKVAWSRTTDMAGAERILGGSVMKNGDLLAAGDTRALAAYSYAPTDKPDALAVRIDGSNGEDSCPCGFFQRTDAKAAVGSRLEKVVTWTDGTAMAAGFQPDSFGETDGWLQHLATDGTVLWSKGYGKSGDDRLLHLVQAGTEIVAVGSTTSAGAGGRDGWVVRTDAQGKQLADYTFGGSEDDELLAVEVMPDGTLMAAGWSKTAAQGDSDGWLVNFDKTGKLLWEKRWGYKGSDGFRALTFLGTGKDQRLMATGHATFAASGVASRAWYVVTDFQGNVLNGADGQPLNRTSMVDKVNPNWESFRTAARLPSGGAIAVGRTCAVLQCGAFWQRFDSQGNPLKIGYMHVGANVPYAHQVLAEANGGFVMVGSAGGGGDPEAGDGGWSLQIGPDDKVGMQTTSFVWPFGFASAYNPRGLTRLHDGHYLGVGASGPSGTAMRAWVFSMDRFFYSGTQRYNNEGYSGVCTEPRCSQFMPPKVRNVSRGCDDENECTTGDYCAYGLCGDSAINTCDDANSCTLDKCHAATGCWYAPQNDSAVCGQATTCADGNCGSGCASLVSALTDNGKHDHYRGIASAGNGGWWVTGSSRAAGFASNNPGDAWAGKLGTDGKLQLLYNPAKGGIDDVLEGIVPLADGSAWAIGWIDQTTDGTNLSDRDLWMVHLGADGKVLDDQAPKAAKWQMLSKGHPSKNGWLFSGSKDEKAWVGERDASGKILWDISMGHANAAFTVATDVTQTADGSLFAPVYGGGLGSYHEGFLLHVTPDKKATITPYINSSYLGAPGTILAQPDGSALLIRGIWNGSKWELSSFRCTGPNLIEPRIAIGIVGNQYAFDAIQLAPGGDLFIAGIGTREWGIDNGAEVWRVTLQGKIVWSEAPQVSATTHSGFWGLAAGPQPNLLTAVGFASKNGAKNSDAWARSLDASGKIFCNGSQP